MDRQASRLDAALAQVGMHVEELAVPPPEVPFTGRRRLLYEVLRQALADLDGGDGKASIDACLWFSDDEASHPFAFATICDELSMARSTIRTLAFDPDRRKAVLEALRREEQGRMKTAKAERESA